MRCAQPVVDDQQIVFYLDVTDEEHLRTERNQLARLLDQHNTVDSVSGLLNHRGIMKGLDPLVSRSRRYENPLSIVTMTVTNFPDVEDSYGHIAVDKMTLVISQLLRDQLRWADLIGRDDSGDFVFVLPETDQKAAISLANKVADQLNDLSIPVDDINTSKPQACFGVASWTRGDDSTQLLNRSNNAAATASKQGAFSVEAA
jgi:diguanylate cyclase (GGDEF)-like protein